MSNYEYDVFFSYKRHPLTAFWISEVSALLRFWLKEEGVADAKVFLDVDSIEAGERWPEKLRTALSRSRCMVAIWSAPYFQSKWCLSEWRTMRRREEILGSRFIVPIRFHDGDYFPEDARKTQCADWRNYAFTAKSFWETPRKLELESEVKQISNVVGGIVHGSPAFDAGWPIVEVDETPAPSNVLLRRL